MSQAREEILRRIRLATRDVPQEESPEDVSVERSYRVESVSPHEEVVGRFVENVSEYRASVRRVGEEELPEAIREALARRGARRLVVAPGVPDGWIPEGVEALRDGEGGRPLTNEELDASDGVLSGCALGIAQSGTIVLDGGRMQGRRALTLLPDYHLCVIYEDQIVELVPEAVRRLEGGVREGRSIVFVSGPSATSDIELDRVEGVHGPRTLEVLVCHR